MNESTDHNDIKSIRPNEFGPISRQNSLSLAKHARLVNGAKNSVIVDVNEGKLFRLNPAGRRIVELGLQGLPIGEISKELCSRIEEADTVSFINNLLARGLLEYSDEHCGTSEETNDSTRLKLVWIETTHRCNLHCIHCYADAKTTKSQKELSKIEIYDVIDQAANLGCRDIQLTGGEVLLRKDLKELVQHASEKGMDTEIFTNGTLITENLAEYFAQKGVKVAVSINSCKPNTHDSITGVEGSFEMTMKGLRLLISRKVEVRCSVVAMKQNEAELDETCNFLSELGVSFRAPDPVRPTGRGMSLENWPMKYGEHFLRSCPDFDVELEQFERNRKHNSCWYGKIAITSEGDVLPCLFARNQIVGNVRNQKLIEIINGEVLRDLWHLTLDRVEVCRDCEYRYFCGDCRPWAYGFFGSLYAKSPLCNYDPYSATWMKTKSIHDKTS